MQNLSHPELDRDSATTQALMRRCAEGDAAASDALFAVIYEDLRRRAHLMLRRNAGNTLSTTALVHETWLKLAGSQLEPKDQSHFFAIAARAMRQVLMNAARDREALKRGGGFALISIPFPAPDGSGAGWWMTHHVLPAAAMSDLQGCRHTARP